MWSWFGYRDTSAQKNDNPVREMSDPHAPQPAEQNSDSQRGHDYNLRSKAQDGGTGGRTPADESRSQKKRPGKAVRNQSPRPPDSDRDLADWVDVQRPQGNESEVSGRPSTVSEHTDSQGGNLFPSALEEALDVQKQLQTKNHKYLKQIHELQLHLKGKDEEIARLNCLLAPSGPASDLPSGDYHTPPSSLSEVQESAQSEGPRTREAKTISQLQEANQSQSQTIKKQQQEITQLKRRMDFAQQLEEQNEMLTIETSTFEEEKRKLKEKIHQLQRGSPQTIHDSSVLGMQEKLDDLRKQNEGLQKQLQEAKYYETQCRETLEENAKLRQRTADAERELERQVTQIDECDDTGSEHIKALKAALDQKSQEVETLEVEIRLLTKRSQEFGKMQAHAKGQSKQVKDLRQEVEAVKAGEDERKEYEGQLMESIYNLQDENKELLLKFQGACRDKAFMEESLKTTVTKNHELEGEVQRLQAENEKLQRENVDEFEKEKKSLVEDLQAARAEAMIYKADFEAEREDRAKAHGKMDDVRQKAATVVEKLRSDLRHLEEDLDHHKELLQGVEEVNQTKVMDVQRAVEVAQKAQEDVNAKTSQVKQYKKQVDQLKSEVAELQKHNIDLIQEMSRVRSELEKSRDPKKDKGKKKSHTDVTPAMNLEKKIAQLEALYEKSSIESHQYEEENVELLKEVEELRATNASLRSALQKTSGPPPQLLPKPRTVSSSRSPSVSPLVSPAEGGGHQLGTQHPERKSAPPTVEAFRKKEQADIKHQLQQQFRQDRALQQEAMQRLQTEEATTRPLPPEMHKPGAVRGATQGDIASQQPPQHGGVFPRGSTPSGVKMELSGANVPQQPPQPQPPVQEPPREKAQSFSHSSSRRSKPFRPSHSGSQLPVGQQAALHFDPQQVLRPQQAPTSLPPYSQQPQHVSGQGISHLGEQASHQAKDHHVQAVAHFQPPLAQSTDQPYQGEHDNTLMHSIQADIYKEAKHVVSTVSEESGRNPTQVHAPVDPNLVCPYCNKQFRIGEIQKFKRHVASCGGTTV